MRHGSVPAYIYDEFRRTDKLSPDELVQLLLVACKDRCADAHSTFKTIAAACLHLQLSNGQRVRDASDFAQFFEEMANRIGETK